MQINCSACGKRLQLADDKIPADRQVRIACPGCHERIIVDPLGYAPAPTPAENKPTPPPLSPASLGLDLGDIGPAPRALLCLDNASFRLECESIMPSLGIDTVHLPTHQTQALTYLSSVAYALVILDATFDGSTPEANPILACIHELSMQQRRQLFVMLCIPGSAPVDPMMAYSQSINLIINHDEVMTCRRTLEQHLTEHKRLYRTYHELCQELRLD